VLGSEQGRCERKRKASRAARALFPKPQLKSEPQKKWFVNGLAIRILSYSYIVRKLYLYLLHICIWNSVTCKSAPLLLA
jgi:hypothetical protein